MTELVARLQRLGLTVTAETLRADVYARLLPSPQRVGRGPKAGVIGVWSAEGVRRAEYLHRLRRLGLHGESLRLLLFMRDGADFTTVQPSVIAGTRKLLHLIMSPVYRHHRARPTRTTAEFMVDEYEEHVPNADPGLDQLLWGTLLDGAPLKRGSYQRVEQIVRRLGFDVSQDYAAIMQQVWPALRMSEERWLAAANDPDPARWREAAACMRGHLLLVRATARRAAKGASWLQEARQGGFAFSSNPLAVFGFPRPLLDAILRELPGRPTRAQLLGAWLTVSLLIHENIDDGTFDRLEVDTRITTDLAEARMSLNA